MMNILSMIDPTFLVDLALCAIIGYLIGAERESRGKPAGIATQSLVIGGAMLFTYLSLIIDGESKTRIAAQIVSGVGFLGAGIILKGEHGIIKNLTTAASIWFAASIGMAIGFNYYLAAVLAAIYAIVVPKLPHPKKSKIIYERTHKEKDFLVSKEKADTIYGLKPVALLAR
jgi:putative Mg2+ transporter-C (MgtC) family protein